MKQKIKDAAGSTLLMIMALCVSFILSPIWGGTVLFWAGLIIAALFYLDIIRVFGLESGEPAHYSEFIPATILMVFFFSSSFLLSPFWGGKALFWAGLVGGLFLLLPVISRTKDNRFFVAVLIIIISGLFVSYIATISAERAAHRNIISEVKPLIEDSRRARRNISINGEVLVWDMRSNSQHKSHRLLPHSLQAKAGSETVTVFMVTNVRTVKAGTYSISGGTAYNKEIDFAVVAWPENEPIGFYRVVGEPPKSRSFGLYSSYGDENKPIVELIEKLAEVSQ